MGLGTRLLASYVYASYNASCLSTWPIQSLNSLYSLLAIESTISVSMPRAVSSHESCCLANCRLLHVSFHCCLGFVLSAPKRLVFVLVASTLTGAHEDTPVLASFAQQSEIQRLVSRGQIVSTDLP